MTISCFISKIDRKNNLYKRE
ncbi:unnamed protein product, partial [Vitis vinifera]|uniref:Uncharacterized protein n=1 Tax=Vitis vinifera TaxID=29760 RepID=D7SL67_VITVI